MTPIWSPEAIDDLASLRAFIAEDNPAAAQHVVLHILHNVDALLSKHPEMGHPGRVPGTRELVIPKTPFIVPYRVKSNTSHARLSFCAPLARYILKFAIEELFALC
jgi:toxin ParE1/3/4